MPNRARQPDPLSSANGDPRRADSAAPVDDALETVTLPAADTPSTQALHLSRGLPSLRARLVAIIFMALLPAFVLLLAVSGLERNRAYQTASREALAIAHLMANEYNEILIATNRHMTFMSQFPEIADGDPAACEAKLKALLVPLYDFLGMAVFDANGHSICLATQAPFTGTVDASGSSYFEMAKQQKRFVLGDLTTGRASGRPNLTFGFPILDVRGNLKRVLTVGRDVDVLNRRLMGANFPEDSVMLVTDTHGRVIIRNPNPEEYVGRVAGFMNNVTPGSTSGLFEAAGLDGVERLQAYATVFLNDAPALYVFVGYTPERIFGGVERTLRASLIGLGVISLVALAAAWLSAESMIVRRIDKLVAVANRMRSGDLSARTGMDNDKSEFGQLAAALDKMAKELEQRNRDNTALLDEMKALNATLEQRVEVRTQQLQTSNTRLLASQAELRRLSAEMTRATENERARIARDIHDQLGQMLTAVKMELRTARRKFQAGGDGLEAKLDDAGALIDETVRIVRRISSDLRPGVLDDFGLAAACDWQLQEFEKRTGITYDVSAEIDEDRVPPATATTAFRILQESLTNVMRHAQATHITVRLTHDQDNLTLLVQDNGRGITVEEQATTRSLGLLGMRERAAQLGGSVEITGAPGAGTSVIVVLPLERSSAGEKGETAHA